MDIDPKVLSDVMSELARRSHKKSPRNKAFYQMMHRKSDAAKRAKKQLSPPSH
jgi:hypothetical protein